MQLRSRIRRRALSESMSILQLSLRGLNTSSVLRVARQRLFVSLLIFSVIVGVGSQASGQTPEDNPDISVKRLPRDLWVDQKRIWTSPVHLKGQDLKWAVPLVFATGLAFGVDHDVARRVPSANTQKRASTLSNVGAGTFAAIAVGQYLWGKKTDNPKLRETGFLSGEAAIDAFALSELVKGISQRQRPSDVNTQGKFFESSSPLGSSFPSQHAAAAFAIATVIAQEYPGPATKLLAYGGASAIGAARILGNNHYTSDVLIGSALGYFVGREVYAAHAADAKMDARYGKFEKSGSPSRDLSMAGSVYVPLDSWIYPALDRLRARGYLPNLFVGQRPWTRMQCAEMLGDGLDAVAAEGDPDDRELIEALKTEFRRETAIRDGAPNRGFAIDSVYTRFLGISGRPLSDGLHFAQTVFNDFGRPYQEGLNQVLGISGHAEAGPFAFYVRGEYQHAPSADPYPTSTLSAIAAQDRLPIAPSTAIASVNRFDFPEAYLALNLHDWQLSFGKQSMWWGPGQSTDLMMSNNAEPITMLRLSNVGTMRLPWILGYLGPFRSTTFVGQIRGYHFLRLGPTFQTVGSWQTVVNPQPYLWGEHFSIKPTENLELGFSITTVFAGLGRPATLSTFRHTLSVSGNAQAVEPGDRRTGFDFSYRLPGLRKWLTLYNGSLAEDEPNPIAYPRRSAMNPGIYLTHVPGVQKLDFRVESVYTDLPNLRQTGITYTNQHYAGGYTNDGVILGSWIGPEARSIVYQSSYWFNAERKLTVAARTQTNNPAYLGGGDLKDFGASYVFKVQRNVTIASGVQYESWNYPVLASDRRSNVSVSFQIQWHPDRDAH